MPDTETVQVQLTQEMRFAVVMYGGSSLAIYMNGVAQELLHLVRATAPSADDQSATPHLKEVSGTERVYREVGRMLKRGVPANLNVQAGDPITTRFVIDIISGTSAGGINGVFLAKALANDSDLAKLRQLWLETADFGKLLNDGHGDGTPQSPPKSIVNSPLLYSKLLDAFSAMGEPKVAKSPYVEQLDLYTTFTDIQGQTIALKLADVVATERQHLHTFHFVYSTEEASGQDRNDFVSVFNPFLAFAARSTSAHPAAFEPMTLNDIRLKGATPGTPEWQKFYEEYLQPSRVVKPNASHQDFSRNKLAEEFLKRPLSDGGILDNSPFSFAIDQLQFRNVQWPVERKLLYVEPAPEHPELEQDSNKKPDALEMALLSLSTLPSYQFIRDDIRRILDRNILIQRVNRILEGIEEDYERDEARKIPAISSKEFAEKTIDELIGILGAAWGGYQRLRVADTTDDLVMIICSAAGLSQDSDEFLAIRYLVRAWRGEHYAARKDKEHKQESLFLYEFDLKRHVRRLKFLSKKAADMTRFDRRAAKVVSIASKEAPETWQKIDGKLEWEIRDELRKTVKSLNGVLKTFYVTRERLAAPIRDSDQTVNPLATSIGNLGIDRKSLLDILRPSTDDARYEEAKNFVKAHSVQFQQLAQEVTRELSVIHGASEEIRGKGKFEGKGILQVPPNATTSERVVRSVLLYYYDHFDQYDMVFYPIVYSTAVGDETNEVDVFRISPEDADAPIGNVEERRKKLAGLSLGHFGALLDERYRVNDIIWGRLDCADRLISALLKSARPPETDEGVNALDARRRELIKQAQEAIIIEETALLPEDLKKELGLVCPEPTPEQEGKRQAAISAVEKSALPVEVREYFGARLEEEAPLERFVRNFKQLQKENPPKFLEVVGRASRILGEMLDDIAEQHRIRSPHLTWITRLLRLFWGLVEVSLPDTWPSILTRHLLKLLYLFEALMIAGGVLLSSNSVVRFGVMALGITLTLHAVIMLLRDFAVERVTARRALISLLSAVLILAAAFAVAAFAGILGVDLLWRMVVYLHNFQRPPSP
jgi:patatin-related protein